MRQFNLSEWLKDKSRKVVTRRGNPARIICADRKHGEDDLPIVFLEENNGGEFLLTCRNDGRSDTYDTPYDLFFADEEEELTELQKTLEEDCDCYVNLYNDGKTREELREWIKCWCNSIIDLARKELAPISWRENLRKYKEGCEQGKQDVLKDLPKWKKSDRNWITNICDLATIVRCDGGDHEDYDSVVVSNRVDKDDYYIELGELLKLPKEE